MFITNMLLKCLLLNLIKNKYSVEHATNIKGDISVEC